jgi:competence protein ComEC
VHVQTATHDLLYDAGPIFSPDANSGNRIIVPYLRAVGVRRLDAFVVTHQDKDHSGGAEAVIDALPVSTLISSLPFEHELSAAPVAQTACHDGQKWEWDGVSFEMLYPSAGQYEHRPRKTNDMSCVLKVTASGHSVLLPSDIEAWSEELLLNAHSSDLKSDVLLVPHHGSRTSSTPEFIAAVAAPEVIFPVGYRNRFNHPRPDVVERYRASGAAMSRTDRDGALTIRLGNGGVQIIAERRLRARYWHGR